ncbi:MAG: penicillin-binding transpeptidase domain-containing protein, partial [Betaproteobacteria bacterium]
NAFTLMQLAQATAVMANDGTYMKPHLLRSIRDSLSGEQTAVEPETMHSIALKRENLDVIRRALIDVTLSGTASQAFAGAPYQAAGKTGTAQVYSLRGAKYQSSAIDERLRDHALFMAYAPAKQPKIAVAVLVENAGWGGSVAAPIARKVFDAWLLRDQKPATTAVPVAQPQRGVQ